MPVRSFVAAESILKPYGLPMVTTKFWSPIVLFTPVLLTAAHPSSSSPVGQEATDHAVLPSSSELRSGFNAAARSAGKLYFGTATNNYQWNDSAYVTILDNLAMFGQLTPAKVMKWSYTEPERGVFTWDMGDQFVALAQQGGKLVRGHNCVWYNDIPAWVTNTTWTAPDLAEVVQEHCFNIVRHWAGQIWDVINGSSSRSRLERTHEPFNDDGTWRQTLWYNTLNTSYIPLALHAARRADPHAKLYINEYNTTGPGPKASALKALVRDLKAAGVPLHGVGVQAHEVVGQVPPLADVKRNLAEFVALGVEVAITELDVRFVGLPPDEGGLERQRRDFETVVRACREVEGCVGVTVWDWTDKYSWVPASFPGEGDACPFDADLEPKPAYYGVIDGLHEETSSASRKYGALQHIKLNHEVVRARGASASASSPIAPRTPGAATRWQEYEIEDVADVLVTVVGSISRWRMPEIAGIEQFAGELHHSAGYVPKGKTWHEDAQAWGDKRVGVIGCGSSTLQIVTALQPKVARVVNCVRGQNWIAPPVGFQPLLRALGREPTEKEDDLAFTREEVERFKTDSEFFWKVDASLNSWNEATILESALQARLRDGLTKSMRARLSERPDIAEKRGYHDPLCLLNPPSFSSDRTEVATLGPGAVIPNFPVCAKRITPAPGYLEALCKENVDFVSSPIKGFTARGIETEDGAHHDLDIVFCATGYDMSWQLPFPILGHGGVALNDKWQQDGYPKSYLSLCTDGFPNLFMVMGPNSVIGAGPFIQCIEAGVGYVVQAVAKMQRERLRSMEVRREAVEDFDRLIQEYFMKTAFGVGTRSWYKLGGDTGRVFGIWPGSVLYMSRTLEHPRWEDFEYERSDAVKNRLYWLGDGQTSDEKSESGDRAWYFGEGYIDRPPVAVDDAY
ncbi:hypothetical protein GSI_08347 [Ganoderma sinense ZZ0214-1]|uniref:Beta-xylanase n=1 Tax=Ganoderma sinense ZZ0214-1 TaxID=1077348 RepID=A0A2G8S6Y5_9APHY|nr:hypothetical protein GSI_08347 [Ganoderma sinense ZZ0214-1]